MTTRASEHAPASTDAEIKHPIHRLLWMLRGYWKLLAAAAVMLVGLVLVNMAVPATIAVLFNEVFPDRLWSLLWLLLGAMLCIYLLRNLLYFGTKYSAVYVGEQTAFTLRRQLFERLQSQNLQFYRRRNPGELTSRVMNDTFAIQQFIQEEMLKLVQSAVMFVGLLVVLYAVNWQLALASTVVLPLHLWVFHRFRSPIRQSSRAAQQQLAHVQGSLIEKFLGMEVVKGFTAEERENEAFVRAIDRSRQSQLLSKKYHVQQKIVADSLVGLATVALLGFGGYHVMKGGPDAMRPGTFIAFFGYVGMLYPTVIELMSGLAKMTRTGTSLERVFEMLDVEGVEQQTANAIVKPIGGRLSFRGVSFRYKSKADPVLSDVSLEVPAGNVCAVMGASGSGKTTLLSLVGRFADPEAGIVAIDSVDVRRYRLKHLRRNVAMAYQETFLFSTSILENIRYAKPDASLAEIAKVAKLTGAHAFIERLPDGYQTVIGEGGVTLSRGEKQRIVLTRALLRKPRILILDEATASLDYASEARIIPQVIRYMKGRTVLIATHRADLLRHVDQVVMLDRGEVAYEGSPRRLPETLASQMGLEPERRAALAGTQMGGTAIGTAIQTAHGTVVASSHGTAAAASKSGTAAAAATGTGEKTAADAEGDRTGTSRHGTGTRPAPVDDEPDGTADRHAMGAGDSRSGTGVGLKALAGALLLTLGVLGGTATAEDEGADAAANNEATAADEPASEQADWASRDFSRGAFVAMTGLNATELEEVMEVVSLQLQTQHGYGPATEEEAARLSSPPARLRDVETLSRREADAVEVLQLGYQIFRAQPPHVWVQGQRFNGEGEAEPSDDVKVALELIQQGRATLDDQYAQLEVSDLESRTISLSYIEADECLAILESLGYEAIRFTSDGNTVGGGRIIQPTNPVDVNNLPIVMALPGPENTTLVGGDASMTADGEFGLGMVPTTASELSSLTSSAPMMQLMILYHPAQPEQLSKLKQRIRHHIDRPARQILMEAMVLEISERGLKELGVEWELDTAIDNLDTLQLGRMPDDLTADAATLDLGLDNVFGHFQARIRALIREGHAEILSRPSVLTLDNRQASIRVGEEIPIATTVTGVRAGDTLSFDFKYLPTGILLNIRPRVSADAEEVSIQVDGIVSDQVPGQDLVIRGEEGRELARAPRISTRRVQNYVRVRNNTPFIIGGLVARDLTRVEEKVPLLGDLPLIGGAFRNVRDEEVRSEVIIVLTPFVLPEDQTVARALPKDEDAFDSFDHRLFRDGYRIRDQDVFDLDFIYENDYLQEMRRLAAREIERDYQLGADPAVAGFDRDRIPGEQMLIYRQMYNIIQRIEADEDLSVGRMIFFEQDDTAAGFSVTFLHRYLRQHADLSAEDLERLDKWERIERKLEALEGRDQALALTFTTGRERAMTGTLEQPVPEASIVSCHSREEWSEMLWRLNQPDDQGRERRTILLHGRRDFERLKTAIVLQNMVPLNADAESQTLRLKDFAVGRMLLMPTIADDTIHLIDTETAMYFYATEHYYPAFGKKLEAALDQLRPVLQRRGVDLPDEQSPLPARPHLPDQRGF